MRIGVPKEIEANENRVGLVPACVRELVARGHEPKGGAAARNLALDDAPAEPCRADAA